MHLFTSHRRNVRRYFAHFDLPLNPICWLFGHKARGEVKEWRYNIAPSLFIRCRWCDRRYRNPDADIRALKGGWSKEKAQAFEAQRIEVFRRDPKMVEADASGREGYQQSRLELGLEVVDRRDEVARRGLARTVLEHAGFKLHLGDRGSETPLDGHVDVGIAAAYWSVGGIGGRLCEFLGRGQKRNIAVRVHGGSLWWELWHDDEGGNNDEAHRCDGWRQPKLWPWSAGRRKHRGWMCLRSGSIDLNPADELWGRPSPDRELLAQATLVVPMDEFPGDTYLIDAKLERWDWARKHGPEWARKRSTTYSVDWRANPGIPVSTDRDWKGNDVLGSGVSLAETEVADWQRVTVARVIENMKADRRHYGYRPPQVTS